MALIGEESLELCGGRQKQRPKHMERILLANHKEQVGLQRRLDFINRCSKSRGKELDREKYKVETEYQFNKRINYQKVTPFLNQIPVLLRQAYPHYATVDPVTVFLLREYKRNSQVIPNILAALEDEEEDKDALTIKTKQIGVQVGGSSSNNDNELEQPHEPDLQKLTNMVREITRIRNEIINCNRIHLLRSRMNFQNLLRHVQDRETLGNDSATYTDGTCSLLRRKMNKMRQTVPNLRLEMDRSGLSVRSRPTPRIPKIKKSKRFPTANAALYIPKLPAIPAVRSHTTMTHHLNVSANKHHLVGSEDEMKRQLGRQERRQTDVKVAREVEEYDRIHDKIILFLERNKRKPQLLDFIFEEEDLGVN